MAVPVNDLQLIRRVVDTARYPLHAPNGLAWQHAVGRIRKELRTDGCSVLQDFVSAERLDELRAECAGVAGHAYYEEQTVNVYNTDPDPSLPADHPGRRTVTRGNAFVARDMIPAEAIIHRLYTNSLFQRFLADCLEVPQIHPLADPLAGLCVNVVLPGREHPWHFDTNEFAVSMLTQPPEAGGDFEYCPSIRSATSENFDDVRAVLDGDDRLVRRLTLRPGDLQLFRGRYSLHRVSTVSGRTVRHTAIFSYSAKPGVVGKQARTRQLFGRVTQAHVSPNVRTDALLD